jgi:hypothetical protein
MKRDPAYLFLLTAVFPILAGSCNNDLDLLDPAPPKPVVFCILNPTDTFCYVTVSRSVPPTDDAGGFFGPGSEARVDDATVTLEAWQSGYKVWETGFSLTGQSRPDSSGQVARSVYRSDKVLRFAVDTVHDEADRWIYDNMRLVVKSPQFTEPVYGRIPLIHMPRRGYPRKPATFNLYSTLNNGVSGSIDIKEVRYASLICQFRYREFTDHWADRSVEFVVKKDIAPLMPGLSIRLTEENLFNRLKINIPVDTAVAIRIFKKLKFTLITTDVFFEDYYHTFVNAGDHDLTVYTNLTNGYGLFACARTARFADMDLDPVTLDSLCNGRMTKQLKFKSW